MKVHIKKLWCTLCTSFMYISYCRTQVVREEASFLAWLGSFSAFCCKQLWISLLILVVSAELILFIIQPVKKNLFIYRWLKTIPSLRKVSTNCCSVKAQRHECCIGQTQYKEHSTSRQRANNFPIWPTLALRSSTLTTCYQCCSVAFSLRLKKKKKHQKPTKKKPKTNPTKNPHARWHLYSCLTKVVRMPKRTQFVKSAN